MSKRLVQSKRSDFKAGERVKVIKIPTGLKDAAKIGTPRIFQRALGRIFAIKGSMTMDTLSYKLQSETGSGLNPSFWSMLNRVRDAANKLEQID